MRDTAIIPIEMRLTRDTPILLLMQSGVPGASQARHCHPEGQLYVASQGLIVVEAANSRWIMPPGRLGWVPPGVAHGASVHGGRQAEAAGYTVYLAPALCANLPGEPAILPLSNLMHAVFQRMLEWPPLVPLNPAQHRLVGVLLDELGCTRPEGLRLVMPRDSRLARLAIALSDDPANDTSLADWAQQLGYSLRSMTRHFRDETGMSISEWRQMARLQRGLEWLAQGQSVTTVALSLGYDSVSSFIALFRRTLGFTPSQFARKAGQG